MNDVRDRALFRYSLIREAGRSGVDHASGARWCAAWRPRSTSARRAAGPGGPPTIDRWIRAWRAGGFDALSDTPGAA